MTLLHSPRGEREKLEIEEKGGKRGEERGGWPKSFYLLYFSIN